MSSDPLVGQTIEDRWVVGTPIGRGGMSTVYSGHDRGDLSRVAIKVLRPGLKPELRSAERFLREARAAARVDHPNVISIIAHGELEAGKCFLVMDLVEGVSLHRAIRLEAPFGPRRAVRIASQIAGALARAHGLGVLHRDLKPANVLLTHRRGEPDVVKVLDFGLAKILGQQEADTLTKAGLIFGTPEYMSPEQAVGRVVDGRCDLYALGAILYEMVVGRPPFKGDGVFETVRMHVAEPPPPPRVVRPDAPIPPMLEGVILRLLEKRPEDRFESAAHLERVLAAVSAYLDRSLGGDADADSQDADSREATVVGDRGVLLDADEAARAEYLQLRRHRQETIRRATGELPALPVSELIRELLDRVARLEGLAMDRSADLAVTDSAAEDERAAAQERLAALRLESIDRQMEASRLREGLEAGGSMEEARIEALAREIEALEVELGAAEQELSARLEDASARRGGLEARIADVEDAIDQCFDELAALVREGAEGRTDGQLAALLDDLDSFDRWIAAHEGGTDRP